MLLCPTGVLTVTERLLSCESTDRDGDKAELATSAPDSGIFTDFGATSISHTPLLISIMLVAVVTISIITTNKYYYGTMSSQSNVVLQRSFKQSNINIDVNLYST